MGGDMCCIVCVDQSERGIKQRLGKYVAPPLGPGFNCICWPLDSIHCVDVKVQPQECTTSTKTKDNVTVDVVVVIQWQVKADEAQKAFFNLSNPKQQMGSYVDDIVR